MTADIPVDLQERLLYLADNLPKHKRKEFIRNVSQSLGDLLTSHPRTVVYAAAGWVVGEILDHLLTFSLPFSDIVICLTADCASDIGAAGGAIKGFIDDRKANKMKDQISHVVAREIRKALRGCSNEKER